MTTLITPLATGLSQPGRSPAATWLSRWGATVWQALEAVAKARACLHLLEFANRCELTQPELAKALRSTSPSILAG